MSTVTARERGPHGVSATLGDGTVLRARLLVGAEGRNSPTREDAGIAVARWDYRHRAIIAGLAHGKPHGGVAWGIDRVVMLLMGILLVMGSTMSIFATSLFPFDRFVGTDASVAGVAFGVGLAIASFRPEVNISWVRAAILYAILLIVYRIVFAVFVGTGIEPAPIVIGIVFAVALIVLYPRRGDLMPAGDHTTTDHRPVPTA